MAGEKIEINLLGTSFLLKTDLEKEYANKVVQTFTETICDVERTVRTTDPLKTAIISGIMITEEYIRYRNIKSTDNQKKIEPESSEDSAVKKIFIHLNSKLDDALKNS